MNISDIRSIGKKLYSMIKLHQDKLRSSEDLGKGAAGDTTHPVDKMAEDTVISELKKLKKPATLISEECGTMDFLGGGPKLLVDPVDGSRNATSGIPLFSISIALIDGDSIGDTTAGYVMNLSNGDEYWAVKGEGCLMNGIPVSTQADSTCKVITYEARNPEQDIYRIMPLLSLYNRARCFGSTALDLAFLAQGALSQFIVPCPSRSFDFAAGCLLVREAGGVVTDTKGMSINSVRASVEKSVPLLASANKELHKKALDVLLNRPGGY